MRAESHTRVVAVLHLAHGFVAAASALGLFLAVAVTVGFEAAMERWITHGDPVAQHDTWVWLLVVALVAVYVLFALLFTVPALAGGFGLLMRKRWARKFVLVSAVVAALDFPFGTAIAVYTLWFLLGSSRRLRGVESSYPARP
jgi:hypothetical protein